ncbi:MAG: imidazole glycerol phosphate synthase subunit HisH [Endomicrobium sp.]|nr:imidazole glycerol phosphate synthase subunit HisH [Endomicrobium sp.]
MRLKKIAIIDYGFGNIRSVVNALNYCATAEAVVINSPVEMSRFNGAILPGVGAFGPAMHFLKKKGFDEAIYNYVNTGKLIYGICLGFQLFFEKSYENGIHDGLRLIPGEVKKFEKKNKNMKIPHMGWNNIKIFQNNSYTKKMFKSITNNESFYFVHSYYVMPINLLQTSSFCEFGVKFCSSITYKNIWGSQFHPEKSGEKGLVILKNFIKEVNA